VTASVPEAEPPTVLVVDDEEDLLSLLEYNLKQEGFGVALARNGVEAMEQTRAHAPDLIILDIMMPKMDGIEVCQKLRKDAHLRTIPIMMLTARNEEEDKVEGLDVGADIYLGKPVSVSVIVSQAKALLRSARRYEDPPDQIEVHNLRVDRDRYLVYQYRDDEERKCAFRERSSNCFTSWPPTRDGYSPGKKFSMRYGGATCMWSTGRSTSTFERFVKRSVASTLKP